MYISKPVNFKLILSYLFIYDYDYDYFLFILFLFLFYFIFFGERTINMPIFT